MHLKPVREEIRIDRRLSGRRSAGVACLVGMYLAKLRKRRIAHHKSDTEIPILHRAPVADGTVGIGCHGMAILVRTDHRTVQVRNKRTARHGKRECEIAVAVVATGVEEVTRMFERIDNIDAFGVVRKIHTARHLSAERSLGRLFPCLVVVSRIEESVGGTIEQLAFHILVVYRIDYAVRDNHAIPAIFRDAIGATRTGRTDIMPVRNGRDDSCLSPQSQFYHSLGELVGGDGCRALNPIAVLHPRLEDAPPLVSARTV